MRTRVLLSCLAMILSILILPSCQFPQSNLPPTITPRSQEADPTSPPQPTPTATPALASDEPTYPARFRVTTTSTETTLGLLSGANWYDVQIISQSENIKHVGFEDNRIVLSQSKERAQQEEIVWVEVEANIAHLDSAVPMTFNIQQSQIGETTVEVFRMEEAGPYKITTFSNNKGEGNSWQYDVSSQPFLDSTSNEYVVIPQINFWYYGDGEWGGFENPDGSRVTPFTPYYGDTYYASDPGWIYQQIEWAVQYGVDAFSVEWTTPRGVGCCGSMEDTLDDVFLVSPNIHKIRWVIFYDFVLRILQTEELGVPEAQILDFNQEEVYNTFVEDFVHFAEKYFGHPQYLTIDGRPVIYIWATNAFTGDFAGAMAEARQKVSHLGYDVFVVGDEVCYGCFNRDHAALFDGSSTFTFLIPGVDAYSLTDTGKAAQTTDTAFTWWRGKIAGLKVTGREDIVNFQPAWAPQYDDSWIAQSHHWIIPAESREQVVQMAEVARKHAEPAGEEGLQLIWVNTWNCWAEGTTIEPTVDEGPKYPTGNYGFDFLEIIRDTYGVETYYTSP